MNCVTYIRVSTQRQGASGLGIEAQKSAVRDFCARHRMAVLREFQEVESGKKNDRKVLSEAIAFAKRSRATLLIAKLDRLARNVAFIANLMESGVDFRACDVPEANRLLLHIMSAVAESEARAISERTKLALTAARERGSKLGGANPRSRNLTDESMRRGRKRGAAATKARAREAYAEIEPIVLKMRDDGISYAAIAEHLNSEGYRTRQGTAFGSMQVKRIVDRTE